MKEETSTRVGLALLWIVGIALRLALLAVPPVIPLLHRDLGLSETAIGALTGLPVLLFAAAATPGSLLIARLGPRRATIAGILLAAIASGLRGAGTTAAVLFIMTFFMGGGIAITQPAIPALVNQWFPTRIGLATAVYVNGILVGETLGASLTLPWVLPLVGGRWELNFVFWALPTLLTGLLMLWLAPTAPGASGSPQTLWWPDWRSTETWQLGLLMGGASVAYFGANAFIPDFLRATSRPHLIGVCLTVLNASQLPAPVVVALGASRVIGRRAPFMGVGAAMVVGLGFFLLRQDWSLLIGAAILGFFSAVDLVLALALPPILAAHDDVHRLSAGMLTISYMFSFVVPLLSGAVWDITHVPATSFIPVAAGALTILVVGSALRAGRRDPGIHQAGGEAAR